MMDIEALMAAAAQTHTNDGGANCAPCGSLGTDPILDVLAAESPNRKIADLTCTYAILDMIRQKFPAARRSDRCASTPRSGRRNRHVRRKRQRPRGQQLGSRRRRRLAATFGLRAIQLPVLVCANRYSSPEVGTTLRNGRRRRTTRSSARSARRCSAKPCVASFRVRTS